MKRLRALWRLARLCGTTALVYPVLILGLALTWPWVRARVRWRQRVGLFWHAQVCAALAVRVHVVGEPPPLGSFLVCNHLSYLDISVIGSVLRTVFVSRADVARWPVIGWLASAGGTIYVERQRKRQLAEVNRAIATALARGAGVVVFPEGTSTRGAEVLPFRPSLLAPAAEGAIPVHCATLHYATAAGDPPAHTTVCWWGNMPFAPHVRELLKLERIDATLTFHAESVSARDRKELAESARARVNARFRPVA